MKTLGMAAVAATRPTRRGAQRDYEALIALIEDRARAPLAWGDQANDCVSFALAAVEAQTGVDLRPRLGCRWSTARGAAKALADRGGLKAATDGVLPRIARAKALRGDIGLVEIERRPSLVVIEGDAVVGPGLAGQVRLPREALAAAWSLRDLRP